MKVKRGIILFLFFYLILVSIATVFAEDIAGPSEPDLETQWVWGEVASLDIVNNIFAVRYLDYETDEEKELALSADEKTIYENAKSLLDIREHDTVSIDYVVVGDKNIARTISVEKPENVEVITPETAPEVSPQDLQPSELQD
ncbi:MAG TPA: hypothetical protein VI976_00595 [Candidatus Omnitrophota bacterium]|nr:hypothetical protein [Candidatus Omnitrophota bacterium]